MLDLNDLYCFVQVVDRQGFTAASQASGIPKSNLSRRVLKLEKQLGAELLHRSSRRFVVTELGAAFYQHCRAMVIEAEEAEQLVRRRQAEPVGRVRFSCPVALGQHVLAELLPGFMQAYPKVQLVERLTNASVDLVEDGFDLALRMHANPLATPGLVHRPICPVQLILVASPHYLASLRNPVEPSALHDTEGLSRGFGDDAPAWHLQHLDGRTAIVPYRPALCSDDWITLCNVAVASLGIAALPPHVCRDALVSGALRRVLPQWHAGQAMLSLFTPPRRGTLPAVRAFADYLLKELPRVISTRAGTVGKRDSLPPEGGVVSRQAAADGADT